MKDIGREAEILITLRRYVEISSWAQELFSAECRVQSLLEIES